MTVSFLISEEKDSKVDESLYCQHEEEKSRHPQHQDLFVVFTLCMQFLVIRPDQEGFQEQTEQQHGSQAEQHLSQEAYDAEAAKQQTAFCKAKRQRQRFLDVFACEVTRGNRKRLERRTDPPKSPLCAWISVGMTAMNSPSWTSCITNIPRRTLL